MLDESPLTVDFPLSYCLSTLRNISLSCGGSLPFCSIRRKKAMQGYFKDEPTKIQWGLNNEEAPLCFQAGIQNYAVNYRRHWGGGRLGRWMLSQNSGSHSWCFRLQLRDSWKGVISEWKGLCRSVNLSSCFMLLLFLPGLLKNRQSQSPLPRHPGVVRSPWGVSSYFDPKTYSFPFLSMVPASFFQGFIEHACSLLGGIY